jgi:D-alanyl-lipoteichoic acid acyltransferase DltB (MBOAT superfamily)
MLAIDSLPFIAGATAVVLGMRLLRGAAGRFFYLGLSALALGLILPDWPSRGAAVVFVLSPWVLRRAVRTVGGLPFALWLLGQAAVLLWIRQYAGVVPSLSGTWLVAHGLAVAGISYMILRQVDWLLSMDLRPEARGSLVEYCNYVVGFLTLLAGPIFRFDDFRERFPGPEPPPPVGDAWMPALHRIVNGYLKIAVLGKLAARLSTPEFVLARDPSWLVLAGAVYLYTIFMYLNFSGYCDVVIGLGRLVGFKIPENFKNPFVAANVQEFWQRWHITFSEWVRDFVFYPLLTTLRMGPLRKRGALAQTLATLVAFVFVGMWHGPAPAFALFGLLHGLAVLAIAPWGRLIERLGGPGALERYKASPGLRVVRVVVCFHFLCLTIALFERDLGVIGAMIRHAMGAPA